MDATAIKLVVNFWHDECPEDPCDEDGWSAYSFSTRHNNYRDPNEFAEDEAFQAKLKAGLAFPLSYFEHGQCVWSIAGTGPQCRWDSVHHAGFVVWEEEEGNMGAKTLEDREKDAAAFVERYTQWCNGEVFGYTLEAVTPCVTCGKLEEAEEPDFDLPSCGGYYGDSLAYMLDDIKSHIGDDWADYELEFTEQLGYGLADEAERRWKEEEK